MLTCCAAANILMTSRGDIKLADFGVSSQLTATMTKKVCQAAYMHDFD